MLHWLHAHDAFPPVTAALTEPNGLLAASLNLTDTRVLEAYRQGIFPWYSPGQPVLWWSPDPRMVLIPEELKISRSLGKSLRKHHYEVRSDTAFRAVMQACAAPRVQQDGTWIVPQIIAAYCALHDQGYAHSIEVWMDGELMGGLYGIALGRMFFGESMFARSTDASKIALAHLVWQLKRWDFGMIDCQVETGHLASLGAHTIPRAEFIRKLTELVNYPGVAGHWILDHDLAQ